ncbi:hypothetical protein QBC45DRAFT_156022 [Copromyces sp. CBS 386.78]|nr:hypothetical protein QBC45DRAFT_156022 [Copromyces sp. CBS 386.78]
MPPYDAHCPWDSDDDSTDSEDESTTSEDSDSSEQQTIPYIKIEPVDEGLPNSLSDSSSSSDSEDENNESQARKIQLPLWKGKRRARSESPVLEIRTDESEASHQLRRENLELRNELSKLQQQIKGVTQDRHDAETLLEEKMHEVEELKKRIRSSSSKNALAQDGSSTGQQANGMRDQETGTANEVRELSATLQARERQHQEQLRQLTKQLEQKEDQYVAQLRELRLSNNLAPDISKLRADLAAEYQAKENAYVERIRQLSEEHAAKEEQFKSNIGVLSSTLYREEFQHQKHINRMKAEKQKVQERYNNLEAELNGAITNFAKEVSELKSRDPFEPARKPDAEIQASWKGLAMQVRQFVQTYCLAAIPFATAQELYKQNLLPGIQTICADPPAVLANPQLCSSLLESLLWEILWTYIFSSRAEGWAGKTGQDFCEAYKGASAHVSSLSKDANWASRVAALHSWKARSFAFLKQLRPISRDDIAALACCLASLLDPITSPTAASGSGSASDSQQPQHNDHYPHQQQQPLHQYHHHHNRQNHYPKPPHTRPSLALLSSLEALLTTALSLDDTFRLSLANYTIIFKDPAVSEYRPSMMDIKPIGFASFNPATSSQRDSVSLNDASVNARAIANSLKVDFAVSPGLLRAGDWIEGVDYHLEVVVAKLVVVCNAEDVLRRPRPSPNPSKPVPPSRPGEELAWLERYKRRGGYVEEQRLEKARLEKARLEKARLGFGHGVNEGVRTQRELMSKWHLPNAPWPVSERSMPSPSMGPSGAGTGVLVPAGQHSALAIPPGNGTGHVQGAAGSNPLNRPYVRTFEYTHNYNNSGGRPNLELTSHFHNTSPITYNYTPSASHPSTYSNNTTLRKDPSHSIGNNPNNDNANTAEESQRKRRRILHRGTRHSPGDPVRNRSEATDNSDSDSDYIDEPTAETSAVTTRGAKRQRLQLLRDGVVAITGAGPERAESASEAPAHEAAPASASRSMAAEKEQTATATATAIAKATTSTSTTMTNYPGAIRDTSNAIFPNLNNIVAYLKNKPRDTNPLSELEDDIIAALEKENSNSESLDAVALLDPNQADQPEPDNLDPFVWEGEESEYGEVVQDVSSDKMQEKNNDHVLVVEIPSRGNRDFAEWQRISWEEGLDAQSPPASGSDKGMKGTRGGMQPTRGRGRGRGRPKKESYRGRGSGRGRGRPRKVVVEEEG